jgi:hypothetical protein
MIGCAKGLARTATADKMLRLTRTPYAWKAKLSKNVRKLPKARNECQACYVGCYERATLVVMLASADAAREDDAFRRLTMREFSGDPS